MRDEAFTWVEKQIRKTRISIGHAEQKPGVNEAEIKQLYKKLDILEWINQLVLAAKEET